jgi:hypothetical protein
VTVALDAGVVLHVAQDGAGHADPRTTQRYNSKRHSLDKAAAYTVAAYIGTIASPPRLPRRRHYRAAQPRPKRASGWAPDSGRGAGERPRALEGRTHGLGQAADDGYSGIGVTFEGRDESMRDSRQRVMGVIAQEVEQAFPEAVITDESGLKQFDYTSLMAPSSRH